MKRSETLGKGVLKIGKPAKWAAVEVASNILCKRSSVVLGRLLLILICQHALLHRVSPGSHVGERVAGFKNLSLLSVTRSDATIATIFFIEFTSDAQL